MAPYGRITHHLMRAREELHRRQPETEEEQRHHTLAIFHLDAVLLLVRRLHHQLRFWKKD